MFEEDPAPARVAVVGSGVAGLAAAWRLSERFATTLYEAAPRLGGHANTIDLEAPDGRVPVDAGFIVFNPPSYPNLVALFEHLGVATADADMSFAVSLAGGRFEYAGKSLRSVFATPSNLASPKFARMLVDIVRFHRDARAAYASDLDEAETLGDFARRRRYGRLFREAYLVPMAAAIWSTPASRVLDHPFAAFVRFYLNHGLLQVLNMPRWRTVRDGSRNYVEALRQRIEARPGCGIRLASPVEEIRRDGAGVLVRARGGEPERYDRVLVATHADVGLSMLADADPEERRILGSFEYAANRAVLHRDPALAPRSRAAWAAWNYMKAAEGDDAPVSVTYWMNALQPLRTKTDVFVSLNPLTEPGPALVDAEIDYDHPMMTVGAIRAQEEIWRVQGRGGVWWAGAHLGSGFHEDGLQAGLAAAEAMGAAARPWTVENPSGRVRLGPDGTWAAQAAPAGADA